MKMKGIISTRVFKLLGKSVAMIALMITTLNVNTVYVFNAHQPEIPESAKKLRKF